MSSDLLGLKNASVFVTGAGGGIGSAIVEQFLECESFVTAHDVSLEKLKTTLGAHLSNPRLLLVSGNMSDEKAIAECFKQAANHPYAKTLLADGDENSQLPPFILCANAGIASEGFPVPVVDMELSKWKETYTNNVDGTFLTIREFLRTYRAHSDKLSALDSSNPYHSISIVVTGSETAVFGQAGYADYASGKAALQYGLVKTLKNEITHIDPKARINAVAPGWVQTPMIGDRLADPMELYKESQATVALRKVAQPTDIARSVVYLSSQKWSGHISGQCLSVDGGMEGRLLYQPEECLGKKF